MEDNSQGLSDDAITGRIASLLARIWDSTAAICVEQDENYRQHGTGILMEVARRSFLVSAGHVFHHDLALLIATNGIGRGKFVSLGERTVNRSGTPGEIDEVLDLAIVELDKSLVEQFEGRKFLRLLDMLPEEDNSPGAYCVAGYPSELSNTGPLPDPVLVHKTYSCITGRVPTSIVPTGFNSAHHILLHAMRPDRAREIDIGNLSDTHPKQLQGISGCGIWKADFLTAGDWSPDNAKLAGIQTSVYPKSNYIKGTKSNRVVQLMWTIYPELRPALELLLPRSR